MQTHSNTDQLKGTWWRVLLFWIVAMLLRYAVGILTVILVAVAAPALRSQPIEAGPFQDGEVLRYSVRWLFIRLGTLEVSQRTDSSYPGRYLITMKATSAAGIPFIDLHLTHRTLLERAPMRVLEERITTDEEGLERVLYWHDHEGKRLVMTETNNGAFMRGDTIGMEKLFYDAVTLLMYARMHATSRSTVTLPTITDFEPGMTDLTFTGDTQSIEVDAIDEEVRTLSFDGYAHWTGESFGGFNGEFKGWVSDDEAAVPLRAEVQIFLGSIVMELESYSRQEWKPGVRQYVQTTDE